MWVANRDDGTVTRIDAATGAVSDTVRVGGSPVAVAAGLGAIWVADGGTGTVIRIDPRTRTAGRRIALGSAPSALAVAGGSVWAAATASRAEPPRRDAAVRVRARSTCDCIDPAGYDDAQLPVLSLAYDGLVAYRRIPGAGGSTLVADLAASVPQPSDGGRTYTFQLRPGLRFSDGTPVRPEDFRASIERDVRLSAGRAPPYYSGIVGAERVQPAAVRPLAGHRDRRRGADDHHPPAAARRASSLHKLAHAARPTCSRRARRRRMIRGRPPPGTGPYTITAFTPGRGVRLVRNPRFRSWSAEARPDGFPDAIDVTLSKDPRRRWPPSSTAGRTPSSHRASFSGAAARSTRTARSRSPTPSHVRTAPAPTTNYLFLNVRARPFDDVRVRRALNYAIDRRRVVALAGGERPGEPDVPGDPARAARLRRPRARSPATPTPGGGWSAPDLERARRLVAASGSRGARVQVLGLPKYAAVARYAGDGPARLGYRVRVRVFPDPTQFFDYVSDSRHHAQVGFTGWIADFLTPSTFFDPFSCAQSPLPLRRQRQHLAVLRPRAWTPAYDAALARARRGGERALGRPRPPGLGGSAGDPAVQPPHPAAGRPTASATRRCTSCSGRCSISSGSISRAFTALEPTRAARQPARRRVCGVQFHPPPRSIIPMRATLTTASVVALLAAGAGPAAARPDTVPTARADAAIHAQAMRSPGPPRRATRGRRRFARPEPAPIVRVTRVADGGFDWADAGIGAGLAAALLLSAAGVSTLRRQHALATR